MQEPAPSPSPGVITPPSSAAIAVIGLKVEPVGYSPLTARSVERAAARARADQLLVFALGQRFGELVRVEARLRADREDLAVARVHRHERPGRRGFAARASVFLAFEQRLFGLFLQAQVERQLEAVPGDGLRRRETRVDGQPFRVDLHAPHARLAAQVAVVVVLEPFLADDASRAARRGTRAA